MNQSQHDIFVSFSFKDQEIAEYVVNRLSNCYNIPCWICTGEILASEHYKSVIVDAIEASKLVLFIQSESSILSREVPKEIAVALDNSKPVIPFVIDEAELVGDLEYDLLAVHRVDATKPTLDDRIEDLSRQIYAVLDKAGKNSAWSGKFRQFKLLPTPSITPKKIFLGRDNVLAEIENNFKNGENVQFLHGIGGIGKTQIAKQYAKRHKNDYDTIIYATYNGSLKSTIISESPFTLEPEMARFTMSDGSKESDDDFFKRKLDKIKKISGGSTLIVIDNFDTISDEDLHEFVSGDYHVLVTTRNDFSRLFPTVKIDAIESMAELKEIFMQNYGGYDVEDDDPYLEELIELVNRHTYTVELLAQHMENSGQTPEEMLLSLKKEGILSLSEEVAGENMKKQVAYENLLKMFKLFSLSEEEKNVLMYLSFMPIEGVNVRSFRVWSDLDSTKLIKDLETKSWIIKNTEGIALHPIIREVVKHEIKATEENCGEFIARFTDTIEDKKTWGMKKSEKDKLAVITRAILERFDTVTNKTADFYYHAQSLFSFAVDADFAEMLAKKIYDFHLETKGENSFETARSAFKIGWIYSYDNHFENAHEKSLHWLSIADKAFSQITLTTSDEKSRHTMTKTNLSKQYMVKYSRTKEEKDFEIAKSYVEDSISHAIASFSPGEFHYGKIAGGYLQLVELLIAGERYNDECLEYIEKAIQILLTLFDESHVDIVYSNRLKATVLYKLGRYEEAKSFAQRSSDGYNECVGMRHPTTYLAHLLLGDICFALDEYREAADAYETAKQSAESIYSPDAKQIAEIKEKITNTENLVQER